MTINSNNLVKKPVSELINTKVADDQMLKQQQLSQAANETKSIPQKLGNFFNQLSSQVSTPSQKNQTKYENESKSNYLKKSTNNKSTAGLNKNALPRIGGINFRA